LTNYGVSHFMDQVPTTTAAATSTCGLRTTGCGQVFEAPPVVKAALCGQGNAHLWAAGTHESIKHVEQIMSHVRVSSCSPLLF
jgi:hypothetical protein